MKINRYDIPISPWDHTATSDFGNWCRSADVARLETSHAELLAALKRIYNYTNSCPCEPGDDELSAFEQARAAIAKAEGDTP